MVMGPKGDRMAARSAMTPSMSLARAAIWVALGEVAMAAPRAVALEVVDHGAE